MQAADAVKAEAMQTAGEKKKSKQGIVTKSLQQHKIT